MTTHLTNRELVLRSLKEELVGPFLQGTVVNLAQIPKEGGPWVQENGQEILQYDSPTKRYGIGVLYPLENMIESQNGETDEVVIDTPYYGISKTDRDIDGEEDPLILSKYEFYSDIPSNDLDLSPTNHYRPSSMGISFLAEFPEDSKIVVKASLGRYEKVDVRIQDAKNISTWWLRKPILLEVEFSANEICKQKKIKLERVNQSQEECGPINLCVELYARPNSPDENPRQKLITICLINRTQNKNGKIDQLCVFQCAFDVTIVNFNNTHCILPYPEPPHKFLDHEELSFALLYRKFQTYAVGHGCAANWGFKDKNNYVNQVMAENLPAFETPSTTPDIEDDNGQVIKVNMAPLAGLIEDNDGFEELTSMINLYEKWIISKKSELPLLPEYLYTTGQTHLDNCKECVRRMKEGVQYLRENSIARKAFELANQAILMQQLARKEPRKAIFNDQEKRWSFEEAYIKPNINSIPTNRGQWRAFQIAFLLMSLRSTAEEEDLEREIVELIWFPTGGGKTEAYLGLAAFLLFLRRLKDPKDIGVQVITRYTLRLLTTQQFQRTSRLICAMEYIRQQSNELGDTPFSVGIWVGGDNTPNTREDALNTFKRLKDKSTENKFVLSQCPWCGAQMGPIRSKHGNQWKTMVLGYSQQGNTVVYKCPDQSCSFHLSLPIYVIDEDIYEYKPSIIIGTVDKFATLAWQPKAKAIFGLDISGNRLCSPPSLIIQDELHLISGPLGSMVGLYETVLEELCSIRQENKTIRPKIISSTATIRRYSEQIRSLYGRKHVVLFPPSGLDADDSFFARYAKNKKGELLPGRLYVGIHGPGLGSLQTLQVRTFASLMQAPMILNSSEKDHWWTLLAFFNSLRELGTTLSLFQSDIPDYLGVIAKRLGIRRSSLRKLKIIKELTGRLRSDEVPEAITALEVPFGNRIKPIDVCLASNILEVGVDIDRLALMAVVGQPKSTSQYIQVTGRVGRQWQKRPGLVISLYTASKPRDRSHFEKFRSYHERLYAQVEPVSVTPFSPPALERALHAIMVMYVRQTGNKENAESPYPYPHQILENLKSILLPRVQFVDEAEVLNFEKIFNRRISEWQRWKRTIWEDKTLRDDFLLRYSGSYVDESNKKKSWATPSSMRNVDAQCQAYITGLYLLEENEEI